MATTIRVDADLIRIVDELHPDQAISADTMSGILKRALIHFDFPAELQYKQITEIEISLYSTKGTEDHITYYAAVSALLGAFSSSVTYNTAPERDSEDVALGGASASGYASKDLSEESAHNILTYGVWVEPELLPIFDSTANLSTSLTTNPPYLTVTYEDTTPTGRIPAQPSGGYISKNDAHTFRWGYISPGNIAGVLSASSNEFNYKKASGDSYTRINTGSAFSYTTEAGLFSDTDTVIWYPAITLNTGQRIYAAYAYTLTTIEPLFTCVPISPIGTIEDGSSPITFTWDASNSAGTDPMSCDLNYSTDGGSTWTWFGTSSAGQRSFTTAANALPAGELLWRVRAITNDNRAGYWSSSASFINIAAPAAPSVSSDTAPFATITWDADGQQAFEVVVDGVSYGVTFGTGKQFTLPQPLSDGNHTAKVRVQGVYGLWSAFGSITFAVSNSAAGTITLSVQAGTDAVLLWSASPSGSDFMIWRDGVQIGHTAQTIFADRRTLGQHTWHVLLRQADGNYTKSNEVTATLTADGPLIGLLTGGAWISLRLMESGMGERNYNYAKTHTLRHFSGSPWPVLELSPYEDLSETVRCAFASNAEALAFEALQGKVVILKSEDAVVIGGLMSVQKVRNTFYRAYQFTIERIAAEEVVDDTDS